MIATILKYGLPVFIAMLITGTSYFYGYRSGIENKPAIELTCPQCPQCPPSTEVSLQNFDLDKLNNKKGNFTYSPALHNVTIRIEAKDSTLLKQILRSAK